MRNALFALVTCLFAALPLWADYLKNSDMKEGLSCWHGDGESVFLKPDGTEGDETDTDAIPVIKLALSQGQPHLVYQDIDTPDQPVHLRIHVEIYASSDFKRSTEPSDYNIKWPAGGTIFYFGKMTPNVDFWIMGDNGANWFYKLTNLKPGAWTALTGDFQKLKPLDRRTIDFYVPPGTGAVYLRNPSVNH